MADLCFGINFWSVLLIYEFFIFGFILEFYNFVKKKFPPNWVKMVSLWGFTVLIIGEYTALRKHYILHVLFMKYVFLLNKWKITKYELIHFLNDYKDNISVVMPRVICYVVARVPRGWCLHLHYLIILYLYNVWNMSDWMFQTEIHKINLYSPETNFFYLITWNFQIIILELTKTISLSWC